MTQLPVQDTLKQNLQKIETALEPEIIAKLQGFTKLVIDGIDDKEGFKAVDSARKVAKEQRLKVEKMRKAMCEEALRYTQAVNKAAKQIQDNIIFPAEEHCKAEIARINAEKERIEREAKIAAEIDLVWDLAHTANKQFDEQKAEAARLESQRIEQERKQKELDDKEAKIKQKEREDKIAREAAETAKREAQEEIDKAKREAAEAERLAKEKLEREAKEAEEAEARRLALAPDIEKASEYFKKIADVTVPDIADEDVKADIRVMRGYVVHYLNKYSETNGAAKSESVSVEVVVNG